MTNQFSDVAVIIPAFNEEAHIAQCIADARSAFPGAALIVVDNNSTDNTAVLAHQAGVTVLSEPNPGKGRAVSSGVQKALSMDCGWLAFHDADNEYDPGHLARLVRGCRHRGSSTSLVMGVGLRQVELGKVLWRSLLANYVARSALWVALQTPPPLDILTGARVLSAGLASRLFQPENGEGADFKGFELETALTRDAISAGAQFVCEPVVYSPRAAHQKKITAWDMFGILKAALKA